RSIRLSHMIAILRPRRDMDVALATWTLDGAAIADPDVRSRRQDATEPAQLEVQVRARRVAGAADVPDAPTSRHDLPRGHEPARQVRIPRLPTAAVVDVDVVSVRAAHRHRRSEEHTSELQS